MIEPTRGNDLHKQTTLLKELLRQQRSQTYSAFCRLYKKAAAEIDKSLVHSYPAERQYYRWINGRLSGLPYPDHCNVLEVMFPGYKAEQLFSLAKNSEEPQPAIAKPVVEVSKPDYEDSATGEKFPDHAPTGPLEPWSEMADIVDKNWPDSGLVIPLNDEIAALELGRRAEASDIGDETLTQLEAAVEDFSCRYPVTSSTSLLGELRQHMSYIAMLIDKRMRLSERRRLTVVGGWLSLLTATVHIDLKQERAARARLRVASSLAKDAEHNEIRAWCYETEAWRVLMDGDFENALEYSRAAQALAPRGSSIAVQSIAQEGRALARMGRTAEMRAAIDRVHAIVSPMRQPDRPEHHYKYDPNKSLAYTATTLAWGHDPAGEPYARELIARLKNPNGEKWPRRAALAKLDLSLILASSNRIDEACDEAKRAILSGHISLSNQWRVAEVVNLVSQHTSGRDVKELTDAYREFCPSDSGA